MKVWPKNDTMRKVLAHPTAGKFREAGHATWPDDSFTHRRIRDGDITTTAPAAPRKSTASSYDAKPASKGE